MYEFHFFSILSLGAAVTYFILGCYILTLDWRNKKNILFFLLCFSMSLWGLGEGMERAATSAAIAMPWAIFPLGLGAAMYTTSFAHFWLEFSESYDKIKHKFLILCAIYVPLIFFTYLRFFYPTLMIVKLPHEYWGYSIIGTKYYDFYQYFVVGYSLIVCILSIKKSFNVSGKLKKQFFNVGVAVIIPVIIGSITQVVLPRIGMPFPELTVATTFAFVIIVAYTIKQYGFLNFDIRTAAKTIVNTISDYIIAIDSEKKINFANNQVISTLGVTQENLIGSTVQTVFKNDFFNLKYDEILQRVPLNNYSVELISKDNHLIPVTLNISVLRDDNKNTIGLVLVARDVRKIDELIKNLEEKNNEFLAFNKIAANRELKMIELKTMVDKQNEELIAKGKKPIIEQDL